MDIKNESVLTCSCCSKNVNKIRFIPQHNRLEKTFLINGDLILCFECAGYYLHETYLKNSTKQEIETIIKDIQDMKNPPEDDDNGVYEELFLETKI